MREEIIGGALLLSTIASGTLAAAMQVPDANILASLAGGVCGALITARDAFTDATPAPVWKVAVAAATSLFVGVSLGVYGTPLILRVFNPAMVSDPAVATGWSFVAAIGGERILGMLLKRLFGAEKRDEP